LGKFGEIEAEDKFEELVVEVALCKAVDDLVDAMDPVLVLDLPALTVQLLGLELSCGNAVFATDVLYCHQRLDTCLVSGRILELIAVLFVLLG
jgi:hypothetical protein